jgi:hypothetical protein
MPRQPSRIFGLSPAAVEQQQFADQARLYGSLPLGTAPGVQAGRGFGLAAQGLLGYEDPQMQRARLLQEAEEATRARADINSQNFLQVAAEELANRGLVDEAAIARQRMLEQAGMQAELGTPGDPRSNLLAQQKRMPRELAPYLEMADSQIDPSIQGPQREQLRLQGAVQALRQFQGAPRVNRPILDARGKPTGVTVSQLMLNGSLGASPVANSRARLESVSRGEGSALTGPDGVANNVLGDSFGPQAVPTGLNPITLAGYNAGQGAVNRFGGIPPYRETQDYVRSINNIYEQRKAGTYRPPNQAIARRQALYAPIIQQAAARYGVDPDQLHAMIQQESGYNPNAESSAGAQGIAQFIPETGQRYGLMTEADRKDPVKAIDAMARHVRDLNADNAAAMPGQPVDMGPQEFQPIQQAAPVASLGLEQPGQVQPTVDADVIDRGRFTRFTSRRGVDPDVPVGELANTAKYRTFTDNLSKLIKSVSEKGLGEGLVDASIQGVGVRLPRSFIFGDPDPATSALQQNLVSALASDYSKLKGLGAWDAGTERLFTQVIPDPTDMSAVFQGVGPLIRSYAQQYQSILDEAPFVADRLGADIEIATPPPIVDLLNNPPELPAEAEQAIQAEIQQTQGEVDRFQFLRDIPGRLFDFSQPFGSAERGAENLEALRGQPSREDLESVGNTIKEAVKRYDGRDISVTEALILYNLI